MSWDGMQANNYSPYEPDRLLVGIGDIACTTSEVQTPSGSCPVGAASWYLTDMSVTTRTTPAWAIVLAIVVFPLGLFCLLAKDIRTAGSVQVGVSGPGLRHSVSIPVWSPYQVADLRARVAYAQRQSQLRAG